MDIAANSVNLQKRIDYALANLRQNAPDLAKRMSWHWTDVVMSNRLRRCAGICRYWRLKDILRVEFSAPLFASISEMDKTDTVIHELAHAVCMRLGLDKGHGYEFKRVCKAMGGSGERCIKLEAGVVKRNLVRRWVMVRKSDTSKLHMRTKRQAGDFQDTFTDACCLGVIQVDQNDKTVKWLSTLAPTMLEVNPIGGKYRLIA